MTNLIGMGFTVPHGTVRLVGIGIDFPNIFMERPFKIMIHEHLPGYGDA